jgi:hypothetical protein
VKRKHVEYLIVFSFILLLGNSVFVEATEYRFKYSTKLKKGDVHNWNANNTLTTPTETQLINNFSIEVTILQNLPRRGLKSTESCDYFGITINGTPSTEEEVNDRLYSYIHPIKIQRDDDIYTYYEYYIAFPGRYEIEREDDLLILTYIHTYEDFHFIDQMIVYEETGMLKKRWLNNTVLGNVTSFFYQYIGGLRNLSFESNSILLALLLIPIFEVFFRRKIKKSATSLRLKK